MGQKEWGKQAATGAASSTQTHEGKRTWEPFSAPLWLLLLPLAPAPGARAAGACSPQSEAGGLSVHRSANSLACTGSCCLLRGGTVALICFYVNK